MPYGPPSNLATPPPMIKTLPGASSPMGPFGKENLMGLLGDPAMHFALGLLEQGGPQRMPVSFGQGIARAGLGASQRQDFLQRFNLANELTKQQTSTSKSREFRNIAQAKRLGDPSSRKSAYKLTEGGNGNFWYFDPNTGKMEDTDIPFDKTAAAGKLPASDIQYLEKLREIQPEASIQDVWNLKNAHTAKLNALQNKPSLIDTAGELKGEEAGAAAQAPLDVKVRGEIQENAPVIKQRLANVSQLLTKFKGGEFGTTGPIIGNARALLDPELAALNANAVLEVLRNLQITKLTPVSDAEVALVGRMFASPQLTVEQNIAVLEEVEKMLTGKLELMEKRFNELGGFNPFAGEIEVGASVEIGGAKIKRVN